MKRFVITALVLAALAASASTSLAAGLKGDGPVPGAHDLDGIDRSREAAYEEGRYSFCKEPTRPLGGRQRDLCALAAELDNCDGLRKACGAVVSPKETSWFERLIQWAGPAAKVLIYVLVIGIVLVAAIPVIHAIAKRRRERKLVETPSTRNRAILVEEKTLRAEITDAETALQLADAHRERGELTRALGLYLTASLAALDQRGSIRIARHRTNGEYVRACAEEPARNSLREIVREVDRVEFGGAAPSTDGVGDAAARARSIVRTAAALVVTVAMLGLGCASPARGSDPAGDELPIEVLRRNGFRVSQLETSLATMPIREGDEGTPVVIVDLERVPLEAEAQAHMMRWVEAGGVLVLFGRGDEWPAPQSATWELAATRDLIIKTSDPNGGLEDVDSDESPRSIGDPIEVRGARTARPDAFSWRGSEGVGFLGHHIYAAKARVGEGIVLGIANDDLFTNVGALHKSNAAALVTLVRAASHDLRRRIGPSMNGVANLGDVRVARAEDGIPPPANPFAALLAAGLGKGAWHALVASILLFLAYGIRHARPRRAEPQARRAFVEHVEATGAFYERARAYAHALAAYGRFVDIRIREAAPRGGDPIAILAAHSGVDPERAARLYRRAMEAKSEDAPHGDELASIEELRRMLG